MRTLYGGRVSSPPLAARLLSSVSSGPMNRQRPNRVHAYMRAIWNGVTIAQSDDTLLVEGVHYFPLDSVDPNVLRSSRMKSLCPWKGLASYYHVEVGEQRNQSASWTYRHPYPWIGKIKNRVAFWNGVEVVPE